MISELRANPKIRLIQVRNIAGIRY